MGAGNADIRVDIRQRLRLEFGAFRCHPLGGTDQSRFFGVPVTNHNGSPRLPTGSHKLTKSTPSFQHGRSAASRVGRAENPRIMVIAENHPFVVVGAMQLGDHVINRAFRVIHRNLHVQLRAPGPHVIGKRKPSLPAPRYMPARKILQNERRIPGADRHRGNMRQRRRVCRQNMARRGIRSNTRSQRIARMKLRIEN